MGHNPLRAWGVQGYDSTDMVRNVTKYAVRVFDPAMAIYELEKSCAIATFRRRTTRTGAVDIPNGCPSENVHPTRRYQALREPKEECAAPGPEHELPRSCK